LAFLAAMGSLPGLRLSLRTSSGMAVGTTEQDPRPVDCRRRIDAPPGCIPPYFPARYAVESIDGRFILSSISAVRNSYRLLFACPAWVSRQRTLVRQPEILSTSTGSASALLPHHDRRGCGNTLELNAHRCPAWAQRLDDSF